MSRTFLPTTCFRATIAPRCLAKIGRLLDQSRRGLGTILTLPWTRCGDTTSKNRGIIGNDRKCVYARSVCEFARTQRMRETCERSEPVLVINVERRRVPRISTISVMTCPLAVKGPERALPVPLAEVRRYTCNAHLPIFKWVTVVNVASVVFLPRPSKLVTRTG